MKILPKFIVLIATLFGTSCDIRQDPPTSVKRDSVGGRIFVDLDPSEGYILVPRDANGPQLEVALQSDSFSITQLTRGGKPPFGMIFEDGRYTYWRTFYTENKEVSIDDTTGDGLPDRRMTVTRDPEGKIETVMIEDIEIRFVERKMSQ